MKGLLQRFLPGDAAPRRRFWRGAGMCLIGLFTVSVRAEPFLTFRQLTTAHGLPGTSVRAITEDAEGIIWIGIEGHGLCRYDGHTFRTYNEGPGSISDDHVECIADDGAGSIWIGTVHGLNRLDRATDTITQFHHDPDKPNPLLHETVFDLAVGADGTVWIGTRAGVCSLDPKTLVFREHQPSAPAAPVGAVNDLFIDREEVLWVMANDGIYTIDQNSGECRPIRSAPNEGREINPSRAYCGTEGPDGTMWFATEQGRLTYDRDTGAFTPFVTRNEEGLVDRANGWAALTDRRGNVWLGTASDGLRIIDTETRHAYLRKYDLTDPKGSPAGSIRALCEDRAGRIWIGTKFHGLLLYHPSFELFGHRKGAFFSRDRVNRAHLLCAATDRDDEVWLGTLNAGLVRHRLENFETTTFEPPKGQGRESSEVRVQSLAIDRDGEVIFGTDRGVGLLERESGAMQYLEFGGCRGIAVGTDGTIYLATRSGARILAKNPLRLQPLPLQETQAGHPLLKTDTRAIYADPEGFVWIGEHRGAIHRYDPKDRSLRQLESFDASWEGPTVNEARSFLRDDRDRLWIASRLNGLVQLDLKTGRLHRFDDVAGLPKIGAFGLLYDPDGNLWISGERGLTRFNPESGETTNFGTQHGLQLDVFEPNAQCASPDGTFFFAGQNGLNVFRPEDIAKPQPVGRLIFTSIRVGDQPIVRDQATVPPLRLRHDQNQFLIDFALLDYSYPGRNEYSYRMSGIDPGWVDSGTQRTASYNSLPPGDYTFQVRGKTPDETWGEHSKTLSLAFHIQPPYWQTATFRFIVGTFCVLVLVGSYAGLLARGKAAQLRLEEVVTTRTTELRDTNAELTSKSLQLEERSQELARARDRLEETVETRTRELAKAKTRAEESDRLKTAFLANMSHEIRTPLNAIMGFSEMLALESDLSRRYGEHLHTIMSNGEMLLRLINDIIEISVIEAGQLTLNKGEVALDQFVDDVEFEMRTLVHNRRKPGVGFVCDRALDRSGLTILADAVRLRQILTNFVSNACKFTLEGSITLRIRLADETLTFSVEDTGAGIDPQYIDRIFDRFYKVRNPDSPFAEGTGLGLSICDHLAKRMGGRVWAESQPGKGSIFSFAMPITPIEKSDEKVVSAPCAKRAPDGTPNWSGRLFLIADDVAVNARILARFLKPTNAEVILAENGLQAVEMARAHADRLDLVLLDIEMPELSGTEALQRIREFLPGIPALAQTAHAMNSQIMEFQKAGFDGTVTKPLSRQRIFEQICQILRPVTVREPL